MGNAKRTRQIAKEGRVNVAIGSSLALLAQHANKYAMTKTELARILILDGLDKLESGALKVRGPGLEGAR